MKINIITLGCSKNIVDSEHIAGHLRKAGFELYFDRTRNDCDVVIVNTCGFIGDAKEESVNVLLEQIAVKKRSRKQKQLIAVGCLIQRYEKELREELPEIDAFYGVHQWGELVRSLEVEYHDRLEAERLQSTPRHYAYLKISEGCNRSCSYCAIPIIRGKHVSRPIEDILDEAKQMVAQGVKELIVIAQDTTYYGLDIYGERRLGELLTRLAEESGAEWIRLHYTYPTSFPTDAIHAIATHHNICKYIDIPLQHISSHILASMQRGIDREGTIALLEEFRRQIPDVAIRTTLIVGYPGETEKDFEELKEFVRQARFSRMGVFAYSPEEGTAAYALGDPVDDDTKQRRIDELMEIQESISLENNQQREGKQYRVLIDRREDDYWIGRTEYDSPEVDDEVLVKTERPLKIGDFYNVIIDDALEHDILGHIVF
ncbi:MAG: 30S ribosomal protein S12 methylthiotransferase RimO [Bacteroidales bacterium]|nr:30S ribosomal protein S12 methylthiotransferase RimO [Bacteroidales bacterium]